MNTEEPNFKENKKNTPPLDYPALQCTFHGTVNTHKFIWKHHVKAWYKAYLLFQKFPAHSGPCLRNESQILF